MLYIISVVVLLLLLIIPLCIILRGWHDMKAFNAMKWDMKNSGTFMEAGRSAFHKDVIYFAAYDTQKCYYYAVDSRKWSHLAEDMRFKNPGLAIIDGSVASVGGHMGNEPTNEVWVWELQDKHWKQDKSMSVRRSDPAVLTSKNGNYIVAVGGNVHADVAVPWTPAVEVYDATKAHRERQWHEVCPLPGIHDGIEATLCNGIIYVFPAEFKVGFKCDLESVVESKVNDVVNPWKQIKCCPLRFSTPTSLGGRVVCCGGTDAQNKGLNDVYMYEENKDSWKKIGHLREGRMYTLAEVCSNTLVVVGGISELTDKRDGSKRLDRVETFILNSHWSEESKKSA